MGEQRPWQYLKIYGLWQAIFGNTWQCLAIFWHCQAMFESKLPLLWLLGQLVVFTGPQWKSWRKFRSVASFDGSTIEVRSWWKGRWWCMPGNVLDLVKVSRGRKSCFSSQLKCGTTTRNLTQCGTTTTTRASGPTTSRPTGLSLVQVCFQFGCRINEIWRYF